MAQLSSNRKTDLMLREAEARDMNTAAAEDTVKTTEVGEGSRRVTLKEEDTTERTDTEDTMTAMDTEAGVTVTEADIAVMEPDTATGVTEATEVMTTEATVEDTAKREDKITEDIAQIHTQRTEEETGVMMQMTGGGRRKISSSSSICTEYSSMWLMYYSVLKSVS